MVIALLTAMVIALMPAMVISLYTNCVYKPALGRRMPRRLSPLSAFVHN